MEEYGLRGAHAALDLSLSGLHETLRTGRAGFRTWAAAESVTLPGGGAGSWRAAAPSCCAGCWSRSRGRTASDWTPRPPCTTSG
ncbi:hypothetical protein ACFQ8S_13700 [Streptomyces virginiae]|uniref:hypothetical protein n=1 Tax=Streptomyces virginiae TaxID=1961 RepID=UPI0036B9A42B